MPRQLTLKHSLPDEVLRQGVTARVEVRDANNAQLFVERVFDPRQIILNEVLAMSDAFTLELTVTLEIDGVGLYNVFDEVVDAI